VQPKFAEILRALARREVEFVVVGGLAMNLRGVTISTQDVDVVANLETDNIERLSSALADLDARYKDFAGRLFLPEPRALLKNRLNLLETRFGRIDILKVVGHGRDYSALLDRSDELEVEDLVLRVASVEMLIEAKEVAGRDKDKLHLHFLRELQRLEAQKSTGSGPDGRKD
jgi:hypothetical protein